MENFKTVSSFSKLNFIKQNKIFNELFNRSGFTDKTKTHGKNCIIFDLRSKRDYNDKRISNISINLPYDELTDSFFNELDPKQIVPTSISKDVMQKKLQNYKRYYLIIIFSNGHIPKSKVSNYKEDKANGEATYKALLLYENLVKKKVRELGLFAKGLNAFESSYKFLISYNLEDSEANEIGDFPTEIFENRLYIGNEYNVDF